MCALAFRIEGLDSLVQLRRLNLSSNRITEIEGIGQLKKLETLKLQNNQVGGGWMWLGEGCQGVGAEGVGERTSRCDWRC